MFALRRAIVHTNWHWHLFRNSRFLFSSLHYRSFDSPKSFSIPKSAQNPHEIFHPFSEFRRGFAKAKGKKSKAARTPDSSDEDEDDDHHNEIVEVVRDVGPSVKDAAASQMEEAIEALSRELNKLRTGRASAGMLDHITVEIYGVRSPLNRVALVSVLDSKTLAVTPYDPNSMKNIEQAIVSSPLGLNPRSEGQRLVAVVPPLTKEHVQSICKIVAKASEDVKQSIRRSRQKGIETIKKASSSISKDDMKRLEKEVDDLTKKFIKIAEDMCKAKEKEIQGTQ